MGLSFVTHAQELSASGDRLVYDESFFAPFKPVTAADILERIPGSGVSGRGRGRGGGGGGVATENRGFGGGDNILIDGKRITSKQSSLRDILGRIPAGQVLYVEVLRGTTAEVDIAGGDQIINIVLKEGNISSGSWRIQQRYKKRTGYTLQAEATYQVNLGPLEVFAGFDYSDRPEDFRGPEHVFGPNQTLLELRDEKVVNSFRGYKLTNNYSYSFENGDIIRLNLQGEFRDRTSDDTSLQFPVDPQGNIINERADIFLKDEDEWQLEIGADYETQLSDSARLKFLAVQNLDNEKTLESDAVGPIGATSISDRELEIIDTGESILRGRLDWRMKAGHVFSATLEGAYNFLDQESFQTPNSNPSGPFPDLPENKSRVEEWRGDLAIVHTWQVSDRVTLESAAAGEISKISQTGDAENSRVLVFAKPYVEATVRFGSQNRLLLRAERIVGQLDFDDFITSTDLNEGNNSLANAELQPERAYDLRATAERRLVNDGGLLKLTLFHDWVSDVIDRIPVTATQDAVGNIGQGRRYGLQAEASLRLDFAGLAGAVITSRYTLERTRVTDPLTGIRRQMDQAQRNSLTAEFRHDLVELDFSYGAEVQHSVEAPELDINDEILNSDGYDFRAYIETKAIDGLTIRVMGTNLSDRTTIRERRNFATNRLVGDLRRIESRSRTRGSTVHLIVSGTF